MAPGGLRGTPHPAPSLLYPCRLEVIPASAATQTEDRLLCSLYPSLLYPRTLHCSALHNTTQPGSTLILPCTLLLNPGILALHVEYAERRIRDGILFIFSPFYEYHNLEHAYVPVLYRVHQAECVIYILVAVSQEYVNTYSTRRIRAPAATHTECSIYPTTLPSTSTLLYPTIPLSYTTRKCPYQTLPCPPYYTRHGSVPMLVLNT